MLEKEKLINTVIDKISKTTLLEEIEKQTFGDIEDIVAYLYEQNFKNKDAKEELIKLKSYSFNRTKKRWAQNAIKDYDKKVKRKNKKELLSEYSLLRDYYDKNGEKLFQQQFNNHKSPESVIEERKQLLLEWSVSEEKSLSSYPYLHQKTKKQVENAILIDITMIIGMTLLSEERNSQTTNILVETPFSAIEHPIFGNTRGKVKFKKNTLEEKSENKEFYSGEYSLSDGTKYDVLVSKEYVQGLNNNVKDLDPVDYKIFLEVMNHRDEMFATQRTIFVKIGDLVKQLYNSDNSKNYEAITERLLKMGNFRLTSMSDDGQIRLVSVFSDVEITPQPGGNVIARIVVSDSITNDYIQRQTVLVYRDKVDTLSIDLAHLLVSILQKERMICFQTNKSYSINRDLLYFSGYIRFKKRTKAENIKEIEKALNEILDRKFIVKSYKRMRDKFQIEFYPIEEQEAKALSEYRYEFMPEFGLQTPLQ
ncbi:hypothetical protein bcgnr5390_15910 [Bacillus luti]|nr:hypothetical protein BC2903_45670 [Bacillus cereus]